MYDRACMSQSVVHKDKHMDVPATRSYHTIFEVNPPRGKNRDTSSCSGQ